MNRLNHEERWYLKDRPRRPNNIHSKINSEIEREVIRLREKTGWGAGKLKFNVSQISETSIRRILGKHNLNY